MIREINRDTFFLQQKAEPATEEDRQIITDLQDTLAAHHHECVGMAANMIGENKAIIIVTMGIMDMVLVNPVITKKMGPFQTEEGCLSLDGVRPTTRYRKITVQYQDASFRPHIQEFSDWTAQIIQHEIDHLNGVII